MVQTCQNDDKYINAFCNQDIIKKNIFNFQVGLPLQLDVESTFQLTKLHFVVCLIKYIMCSEFFILQQLYIACANGEPSRNHDVELDLTSY